MRQVKSVLALILTLLFISQAAVMAAAAVEIQHPEVWAYGQVTKTVYPGRSIFEYKDDQGLSSTLPFERQDENITINFANIVFSKNFENKSISLATETKSTEVSVIKDVLTQNEQEYIYLKMTNSSAVSASKYYYAKEKLLISNEPSVTNEHYIYVTAKPMAIGDNVRYAAVAVIFHFKDSGATERTIGVGISDDSNFDLGYWITENSADIKICLAGKTSSYTYQAKIQDILDANGVSWSLVKLIAVTYAIQFKTGDSLDASAGIEAEIKHTLIFPSKVYIDDPSYTNGLVVNGTSGSFTSQASDIIQIYGANATKIVGVTIPWQVEVTPEIDKDPDNLKMQYTWEFTMPKSPSEIGDTLTFSNTNMTLYGYKDGDAWDKLYLNGVDKLSSIASLKVPSDADYWTYGLASSLTEGNMYQVIGRVQYTADEYDALCDEPLWYLNFWAWLQYKFWTLVIAITSFLGLSTAWAVKQRRKAMIPKTKYTDLTPFFSATPFVMMDLTFSLDLTTIGFVISVMIIIACVYLLFKKPEEIRRLKRRITDKDIRVGRKSYNLLNMSIFLFAGSGILVLLSFIPGVAWTWLPTVYMAGLILGFVLLFIDGIKG